MFLLRLAVPPACALSDPGSDLVIYDMSQTLNSTSRNLVQCKLFNYLAKLWLSRAFVGSPNFEPLLRRFGGRRRSIRRHRSGVIARCLALKSKKEDMEFRMHTTPPFSRRSSASLVHFAHADIASMIYNTCFCRKASAPESIGWVLKYATRRLLAPLV